MNNITVVKMDGDNCVMLSDLSEEDRHKYLSKYTDAVASFVVDGMC